MKCKLIRDMEGPNPRGPQHPNIIKPAGTEIEHLDCWRLVQMGVAVPADDECRKKADRTPDQMEAAQVAYERLSRGIHPEDFEAYDAGLMIGYDENGDWIPGPKYVPPEDEEDG